MTTTDLIEDQAADCGDDLLLLENQLCFGLYATANAVTKAYRSMLGELGLTYPQYLTLLALWHSDRLTVSELGVKLRLDSGTLTPLLKRLETAGFVSRSRTRADEREVEIALTDRGRALRAEAGGVRAAVVCKLGMSETEIRSLRRDLNAILDRLDV